MHEASCAPRTGRRSDAGHCEAAAGWLGAEQRRAGTGGLPKENAGGRKLGGVKLVYEKHSSLGKINILRAQ